MKEGFHRANERSERATVLYKSNQWRLQSEVRWEEVHPSSLVVPPLGSNVGDGGCR